MKRLIATWALAIASLSHAQMNIPVHLSPEADAPQIGTLEAMDLAVPAEWPSDAEPQDGWKPVYYRGVFEVYVENNDIGKDLSPLPGTPYYLEPDTEGPKLSVATDKDATDILSVDTWFCKMQLETIILGYVPESQSIEASSIVTNIPEAPAAISAPTATDETVGVSELEGRLEKIGLVAKNRTGLQYKLSSPNGKRLAFIDVSGLPELIHPEEFIGQIVRAIGVLEQSDSADTVILRAESLKKTN